MYITYRVAGFVLKPHQPTFLPHTHNSKHVLHDLEPSVMLLSIKLFKMLKPALLTTSSN